MLFLPLRLTQADKVLGTNKIIKQFGDRRKLIKHW